jgi:hypothetical protein
VLVVSVAMEHVINLEYRYRQGYFCDEKCWDTILEAVSLKDASQNGVLGLFFSCHLFYDLLSYCSSFKLAFLVQFLK